VLGEADFPSSTVIPDPIELWMRWNETTSKVLLNILQNSAEATTNYYGLYHSWVQIVDKYKRRNKAMTDMNTSVGESLSKAQEQIKVSPFHMMNLDDAWKTWLDITMVTWRKAAETGGDPLGLSKLWLNVMEEAQAKLLAGTPLQTDPFTLFKEWYDATSDQWSKTVEEIISSKQFLESTRPFLESYAGMALTFRRANEAYFKQLQLPTLLDVANVAQLVVNVEEKIDKIEDSLENFEDSLANIATLEALTSLEQRLYQVATVDTVASLEQRLNQVATNDTVASLGQRLNQVATNDTVASLEQRLNQVATNDTVASLEQRLNQVATNDTVASLEQRLNQVATNDTVSNLEQRLNQVEDKLDRVLLALEKLEERNVSQPAPISEGTHHKTQRKSTSQQEPQQ